MDEAHSARRELEKIMAITHIHRGGTAITNFSISDVGVYEEAILRYGKGDLIVGQPMPSMSGVDLSGTCLALHSKTPGKFPEGISEFWSIFDALRPKAR